MSSEEQNKYSVLSTNNNDEPPVDSIPTKKKKQNPTPTTHKWNKVKKKKYKEERKFQRVFMLGYKHCIYRGFSQNPNNTVVCKYDSNCKGYVIPGTQRIVPCKFIHPVRDFKRPTPKK